MTRRAGGEGMREPKPAVAITHGARKRFGQHFLTDPSILGRIADAVGIVAGATVVEIGPGRGALTAPLVSRVGPSGRLIAVEVDRDLAASLRTHYAERPEVTIHDGDVLDTDIGALAGGPYLLAGNIPYNITTPILFHALERPRAERMVFLVQREVAERLAAAPASEAYGALSANVQAVATIEILFKVSAGAFVPPPQVDSAVIRVTPRTDPDIEAHEEAAFRTMVQGLFSFRRKQMVRGVRDVCAVNGQGAVELLDRAGIRHTDRPEVLGPADFARLLRAWTR